MTADPDDIAALRADGDLVSYLLSLAGKQSAKPKPAEPELEPPAYRITHTGGWPLGTAASGPTPPPDRCSCVKCTQPVTAPHERHDAA